MVVACVLLGFEKGFHGFLEHIAVFRSLGNERVTKQFIGCRTFFKVLYETSEKTEAF
jgi:hypothetical protein